MKNEWNEASDFWSQVELKTAISNLSCIFSVKFSFSIIIFCFIKEIMPNYLSSSSEKVCLLFAMASFRKKNEEFSKNNFEWWGIQINNMQAGDSIHTLDSIETVMEADFQEKHNKQWNF